MWDVAAEAGLYRLRGHRDMVTDVAFVERGGRLLSASKDSHVRVWELADRVEVGVHVAPNDAATDVLQRVREVTEAMREGDEIWEVGLLTEP